jgi:APA family basic amino acid/polyamine antiporter
LALIAGLARTTLAMARHHDLPHWLAAVHPRYRVPHRAEAALAVLICVIVAVADLRGAIGFSSFGVLLYYLVANASAWTQDSGHRRYWRWLAGAGTVGCVVLVATLPPASIAAGLLVLAIGVAYRLVRVRRSAPGPRGQQPG